MIGDEAMKPVETTKRLEAIKEKVKAKTIVEQLERDERPPIKLLERQIMVNVQCVYRFFALNVQCVFIFFAVIITNNVFLLSIVKCLFFKDHAWEKVNNILTFGMNKFCFKPFNFTQLKFLLNNTVRNSLWHFVIIECDFFDFFQVETLRYEQERLQVLRDNAKIEQEKLNKDVLLADIEIEKARYELEILKRRRQM